MSLILAVDIGTTTLSALLFDSEANRSLTTCTLEHRADLATGSDGWHEQDPERLIHTAMMLMRETIEHAPAPVEAIAISGQMHGILLADDSGQAITPLITWRDQRGISLLQDIDVDLLTDAQKRTGCRLSPGYGGLTLAYLLQQSKEFMGRQALGAAAYLACRLCGALVVDETHAASWGIYDLQKSTWDKPLCQRLNIPLQILPPLVVAGELLGGLTEAAAAATGLPKGLPVHAPLGDNQAAVLGAGARDGQTVLFNLGTGGQVSVPVGSVETVPGCEVRPMPGGGYIQVGSSLCGGWSYAYLKDFFQAVGKKIFDIEVSEDAIYSRMNKLSTSYEDATDLKVIPTFLGTREDSNVRGAITGIDVHNFRPAQLCYAFAAGMVEELVVLARRAGADNAKHTLASGNAVRHNPMLCRLISSRMGLPCTVSEQEEEAACGAAWLVATRRRGEMQ